MKVQEVLRQKIHINLGHQVLLLGGMTLREIQRENSFQKIIITSFQYNLYYLKVEEDVS